MKTILTLSFLLFSICLVTTAQVPDASYTDCDGNTESIYDIIGQGKPLIIASKGLDCSICMGQAPGIKTFSEQNPQIRIWGAMNNKYSTVPPTCPGVNDWKTDYGWNNIFMFPDVNDEWQGAGYPTYYVISPVDSQIAYEGFHFSQASALALSLAPTGISPANEKIPALFYDAASQTFQFNNPKGTDKSAFILVNYLGRQIFETNVNAGTNENVRIALPVSLPSGVYIILLRNGNKIYSGRIHTTH